MNPSSTRSGRPSPAPTPRRRPPLLGGLFLALPFLAGCATQGQIQDYQDEIRALREERTQLKKENRGLRSQLGDAQSKLIEASAEPVEPPAEQQILSELDSLGIDYGTRDGNFMISLPAAITFASGSADLSKQGQEALRAVGNTLRDKYPEGTYWIEGHTDNDPISKSKWESNRQLSVYRAMAVHRYMVEQAGFPDEQFVVAGHGEYLPIEENDSPAGKARNRRVEIIVHRAR